MKLVQLPIKVLQQFNPADEDFAELETKAGVWVKNEAIEAEQKKTKTFGSVVAMLNEHWFARIVCGFVYIFANRAILDYLNPSPSAVKRKRYDDEESEEEMAEKYERYLRWSEKNA